MATIAERLDAVYAKIPDVACKGLCHGACGPIPMTADEYRLLRMATGVTPGFHAGSGTCVFLTDEHRCAAHARRPAICRLYGVAEGLLCEHGCTPARVLTEAEAHAILREIAALSHGQIVYPEAVETP